MKKKMHFIIIIFLFSLVACESQTKKGIKKTVQDSTLTINYKNSIEMQSKSESDSVIVYAFENDTLLQRVEIKFISKGEISFKLVSENKQKDKFCRIDGIAKGKMDIDPEIDEDEEGNAYPAQQYFFEKNCWLSIRIDIEKKDKLQVIEANCENLHDSSCPFSSVGILRKIKN